MMRGEYKAIAVAMLIGGVGCNVSISYGIFSGICMGIVFELMFY